MRILFLSNLYPPNVVGGYERLCFEVAQGLSQRGHAITVLTSRYGGKPASHQGQTVIQELDLLTGPDIYTPWSGTPEQREAINRNNLATLARVQQDERPDIIFAWNLFFLDASMLDALSASAVRVVLMLTDNWLLVMRNPAFVSQHFTTIVHGDGQFPAPPAPNLRQRLTALLGKRRKGGLEAIFGSAFMRDLYAAGGCQFSRTRVIHNGVKISANLLPADRSKLVQAGTLRLLFAGRLVDLKGAHTAVAALPLLDPASLGVSQIQLTLVGDTTDAGYMAQLHAAIEQSGHAAMISLRPSVAEDQLPALFNAHDIYLFPSLYEPFSLTLIHALGLGIPTIASRVGGNTEIIRDGENGLLFAKGDAADLAAAINRLAADPALRMRLAVNGRSSAAQFTYDRMVNEMAEFLSCR